MLQGRIGTAFATLAVITLIFNALFDTSPQALFNICENSAMAILFLSSCFKDGPIFKAIQLGGLLSAAFISFKLSETPFFGSVMIIFVIVLFYAYGGYRTFKGAWLMFTLFLIFSLSFLSIANFIPLSPETFSKALVWSAFICVFCFVLWLVVSDIEKRFHEDFAKKIIEQNRQLLELNKELAGGCKDADNP